MECLDCVSATARLHLYIDRELSPEEVEVVQQHLAGCPSCEGRFFFDLRLKRLVHERCTIMKAPEHLRDAVLRIARGEQIIVDQALAKEIRAEIKADLQGC